MFRRGVTLINSVPAKLTKGRCVYLLPGLLVVTLIAVTFTLYNSGSRPLERCLGRHLRERSSLPLEVVHFGAAQIAAHVGEPRGELLWACSQVQQALQGASPSCTDPDLDEDDGRGEGQGQARGRCVFVELGGPGLCAFEVAKQMPWVTVRLLPSSQRLANVSTALNGGSRNVRLLSVEDEEEDVEGGGGSGDRKAGSDGGLLKGLLQSLEEEQGNKGDKKKQRRITTRRMTATSGSPYMVVQVNLHHTLSNTARDAELELVRELLARGAVHAAVVLLPTGSGAVSGGGGAAAAMTAVPAVRQHAADIISAAAASNLKAYWGGFDGLPISEQDLRKGTWPRPAAEPPQLAALTGIFLARSRAPAPAVHLLVPLRIVDPKARDGLVGDLCHYLLDTAACSNLTVHVVGLTPASDKEKQLLTGRDFELKLQKLPVLQHAMLKSLSIAPSDIVITVDAIDTLAQAPAAALREAYLRVGAPVMSVATELNCWPRQFMPWCRFYGPAPRLGVPREGQQQQQQQRQQERQQQLLLSEEWRRVEAAAREELEVRGLLPNKYINSGGFMGRAVVVTKYLRDVVDHVHGLVTTSSWFPDSCGCLEPDDQALLACAYLFDDNPYGITLDYRSDFFYSVFLASQHLTPGSGSTSNQRRWVYNFTSATPFIMHGNGWDGKERLDQLRELIVGSDARKADAGYEFLVDGKRTRYGEFCPRAHERGRSAGPGGAS